VEDARDVRGHLTGIHMRRMAADGLVEARFWNYRREWKLTRTGWAFVQSE
jgi:hypothetical protein